MQVLRICAVVLTYRRSHWLDRCVKSLVSASRAAPDISFSAVVGVNGEDDASMEACLKLKQLEPKSGLVVQKLTRALPGSARNRLISTALESYPDTEWLLFIDDDAYVEPDYFKSFSKAVRAFPSAMALGGPNLTPPGSSLFQRATGVALSSRFAAFLSASRYRQKGEPRACGEEALILCNLFVRREAIGERAFPEHLVCNEENWLLQTLSAAQMQAVHIPKLAVFHERRPGPGALAIQVFRYGWGRGQNLRRRPRTFRFSHVLPSLCLLEFSAALFLPASVNIFLTAAYLSLCLFAAAKSTFSNREGFGVFLFAVFLFPVIHCSYGAGVLWGFLKCGGPE